MEGSYLGNQPTLKHCDMEDMRNYFQYSAGPKRCGQRWLIVLSLSFPTITFQDSAARPCGRAGFDHPKANYWRSCARANVVSSRCLPVAVTTTPLCTLLANIHAGWYHTE